jgi:para-nitrobenzyl esterase
MKAPRILASLTALAPYLLCLALCFPIAPARAAFTIDTLVFPSPITGLWWNQNESGWGISITQQGQAIFAAWYTYDPAGAPVWYVMPSCPVVSNGCTGDIYNVAGGTSPLVPWNGSGKIVSRVGSGSLTFTDIDTGTLSFSLNGVAGKKSITRQQFASGTTAPATDYSDLWWNPAESGWGVALAQQFDIIFVTWYAYDGNGNPVWYVASNCKVAGSACTGDLYKVTGGSPPTSAWNGANKLVTKVGNISFSFTDDGNGGMSYTIDGVSGSRVITRQLFGAYSAPGVARSTRFGSVTGTTDSTNGANAWLGIPYAAPPVGALRWAAPTDPAPWSGALEAKQFAGACMQQSTLYGPPPLGQAWGPAISNTYGSIVGNEDCLYLNIWAPVSGEDNLPVLVYIHGGGNRTGWTGVPDYSGARLAGEQKIVVVTVAYRLGTFGWLSHDALKTGDAANDSGNFGTLDIIKALNFVNRNIANFGGDPNNVTVSGQSSGGKNTWSMILSPLAAGLIHKAVPLSDGVSGYGAANAATFATALLRQSVIDDGYATDAGSADAYLARLGAGQIKTFMLGRSALNVMKSYQKSGVISTFVSPYYDGVVQPPASSSVFVPPFLNSVPVLSGITNQEGKLFPPNGVSALQLGYIFGYNPDNPAALTVSISDLLPSQYLPADRLFVSCSNTGYNAYAMNCPSPTLPDSTLFYWGLQTRTLNGYQRVQPNTFAYNFIWSQQPEPWKTYTGAAHETDVPFMFGNFSRPSLFGYGYSAANKNGREALSLLMRKNLSTFMRSGNPNHAALTTNWLPWDRNAGGAKRLLLNANSNNASTSMSSVDNPEP